MYLSYFGIRVTDLRRSAEFYMRHFGLQLPPGTELPPVGSTEAANTLLIDPRSGQRIELNFYPKGNPYAVKYVAGEGFDHLAFRVDNVEKFLARLMEAGIAPEAMKHYKGPMFSTPTFRVAYIRDPDNNQIELYDTTESDPNTYNHEKY
jgi:catechol 2,3-dioxygenase-like lactoylglutathione lyase family enzyme